MANPISFEPVLIEKYADIGEHALIMPGVTIGEGALIGAGAVVTKSVPKYEIWVGNPARKLRDRDITSVSQMTMRV
jgi:acetyltransferase-like isoleucine patch superfamily enzyme